VPDGNTFARARRAWWREFVQLYGVALAVTALPVAGVELTRGGAFAELFGAPAGVELAELAELEETFGDVSAPPPALPLPELLEQAGDRLLHADLEAAIAAADEAAALDRTSERAVAIKASALIERYFVTGAASDLESARAIGAGLAKSAEPAAATALGNLALVDGDVSRAIERFATAARADPSDAYARHQLGFALQRAERLDEAIASLQEALVLSPDMAWVRENLAECLNNVGVQLYEAKRYVGAVDRFHQAIQFDPNHGLARANLAMTLLVGGNDRLAAKEQAELARQLGATDHPVFAALGL
jgi:Flp pilus assembly protein TadD